MYRAFVLAFLPLVKPIVVSEPSEYRYSYAVEDAASGDSKSQRESRVGGVVQGSYSVLQPDGVRRTVHYTADHRHGFRAVVENVPVTPPKDVFGGGFLRPLFTVLSLPKDFGGARRESYATGYRPPIVLRVGPAVGRRRYFLPAERY